MKRPGTRARLREAAGAHSRAHPRRRRCAPRSSSASPAKRKRTSTSSSASSTTVEFDHVGVFTYSHEEGTTAFDLTDDVPAATKKRRQNALMARQKALVDTPAGGRASANAPASGRRRPVARARARACAAASQGQAPDIDPLVYLTECDPVGATRPATSSTSRSSGRAATT